MKLWFFIVFSFICVLLVGVYGLFQNKKARDLWNPRSEPVLGETTQSLVNLTKVDYQGQEYSIALAEVDDPAKLTLLSNFSTKESASQLALKNNCRLLVNAGFYDKSDKPIGLFISEYNKISEFKQNKLFNGFLSINDFDVPRITNVKPRDGLRIAIQTGPLLQLNNEFMKPDLESQKNSRRMIASVSGENKLYFLAIYKSQAAFLGPSLDQLGNIISLFEKNTGINFADSVNLDGGSASAFLSKDFFLTEISPIGSAFCLN